MLFHVVMTVSVPAGTDDALVARLGEQEHERAAELQRSGKWLHLWRIVGQWSNVSVFDVASGDEMHAILESLPLHRFMRVEVTALAHHPGAIVPGDSPLIPEAKRKALATSFIEALGKRDAELLRSITTEDVTWSLPGSSVVAGVARGVGGIMDRAKRFAEKSLSIQIEHVVVGHRGVALLLHNTGQSGSARLDEHLTTVIQLEGERIHRLDTYITDVPMLDRYFATP